MAYTVENNLYQAGCYNSCVSCLLGEFCHFCANTRPVQLQLAIAGVVAAGTQPCSDCANANGTWTVTDNEDTCIQAYCQYAGAGPTFCGIQWDFKVDISNGPTGRQWLVCLYNPAAADPTKNCVVWRLNLSSAENVAGNCMPNRSNSVVQVNPPVGCDFSASTLSLIVVGSKMNPDYDFTMTGNWVDNGDGTLTLNGGIGTLQGTPNSNPQNPNAPAPNGRMMITYGAHTTVDGCSLGMTLAGHTFTTFLGIGSLPKRFAIDADTGYSTNVKAVSAPGDHALQFGLTPNNYLFGQYVNAAGAGDLAGGGCWYSAKKLAADPGAVPDWSINCDAQGGTITVKLTFLNGFKASRSGVLFNGLICPNQLGLCVGSGVLDDVTSIYYDVTISGVTNGSIIGANCTNCPARFNGTFRIAVLFPGSTTQDAPQGQAGANLNLPCTKFVGPGIITCVFGDGSHFDQNSQIAISFGGGVVSVTLTTTAGAGTNYTTFTAALPNNDCLLSGGDLTLPFNTQFGNQVCQFAGATVVVHQPHF